MADNRMINPRGVTPGFDPSRIPAPVAPSVNLMDYLGVGVGYQPVATPAGAPVMPSRNSEVARPVASARIAGVGGSLPPLARELRPMTAPTPTSFGTPTSSGVFDAPVAPQMSRNPATPRQEQPSLTAKLPGAPKYSLEDFLDATKGLNVRQMGQLVQTLPAQPKAPTVKEQAGTAVYRMIQNQLNQRLAAATDDAERLAATTLAQQQLQQLYGVNPLSSILMDQGILPEE